MEIIGEAFGALISVWKEMWKIAAPMIRVAFTFTLWVLSAVLIVQCFMFADGGITTLGANIFNMGIIGGVVGWMIYAGLARLRKGLFGCIFAAVVAAWASTVLASISCAGELAASGTAARSIC